MDLVGGHVDFRILGSPEVVEGGRSLPLGGLKQRALLAVLLRRANEVVSTDRLIDELWGEEPPWSLGAPDRPRPLSAPSSCRA